MSWESNKLQGNIQRRNLVLHHHRILWRRKPRGQDSQPGTLFRASSSPVHQRCFRRAYLLGRKEHYSSRYQSSKRIFERRESYFGWLWICPSYEVKHTLCSHPFNDLNIGSLPFMPPEAAKDSYYCSKTDVWAFGVFIFELLHGESPYAKSFNIPDLIDKLYSPLDPKKFRPDLSQPIR